MAEYWVPAHISGFFEPHISDDPMMAGSRNCGPCLSLGVRTAVGSGKEIRIEGEKRHARTTEMAVEHLIGRIDVKIVHRPEIPVGAGFGASGAGALGAVLAVAEYLGLPFTHEQILRSAHAAEVLCRTGLGDVGAQALGGFVATLEPGAPPHGAWRRIVVPPGYRVVCCVLGKLETADLLSDSSFLRKCRRLGARAVRRIRSSPTLRTFLAASEEFAGALGLMDDELRPIVAGLKRAGALGASQIMLGRGVFSFVSAKKLRCVKRAAIDMVGEEAVLVCRVSEHGPRRIR
jgi:pantoate kinase